MPGMRSRGLSRLSQGALAYRPSWAAIRTSARSKPLHQPSTWARNSSMPMTGIP